jgi:hypothetical protein
VPEEVRRLPGFPRNLLLEDPVLTGRVSELALLERLGAPTADTDESDLHDPRQFWDLEWPCGLVMALEYHQLTEELVVRLDALDVDHALRHLDLEFELRDVERTQEDQRDRFDRHLPRPADRMWRVLRRGDDDSIQVLARNLTERDARCRAAELEDSDQKHAYWVDTGVV